MGKATDSYSRTSLDPISQGPHRVPYPNAINILSTVGQLTRVIDGPGVAQDPSEMLRRCYVSNSIEIRLHEPFQEDPCP